MGGKGAFAREVQAAVLDGRADLAVHSGKDLPSTSPEGLVVAAVLERHDPRDVIVGGRLAELPPGARVGTGSLRRRAQLAWLRPDLTFAEVRGNVGTRLAKLDRGDVDVLVLALAGLRRLGLEAERTTDVLDVEVMVPQVAQGTLAVECRADDRRHPGACWPPSSTRPRGGPSKPSGRSWLPSAATATSPPAPTPAPASPSGHPVE